MVILGLFWDENGVSRAARRPACPGARKDPWTEKIEKKFFVRANKINFFFKLYLNVKFHHVSLTDPHSIHHQRELISQFFTMQQTTLG